MSKMLNALRDKRSAVAAEASALLDGEPTAEALETVEARQAELASLDAQIKSVEETEARTAAIAESREAAHISPAVVTSEPNVYSEHSERSYFRDLANATVRNDRDSWDRLYRHMNEVAVETRAGNDRTDGNGGEFVPPLWLTDLYAKTLRPGRVAADQLTKMALPAGTDSISIPRITTGATVAVQAADGDAVSNTDLVTTSVTAPVRTIAGYSVVSQQLLDQSPLRSGIDQMIFTDLMADYDYKLDYQVLQGVGTAGALYGLLNTVGIGTVTYTSGTPTAAGIGTALAQAISTVAKNRYQGAEAIVMHPSIFWQLVGMSDSQGRPLVVPNPSQSVNAFGNANAGAPAQGFAGTILGLPVYVDAAIAASSSQLPILVAKFSDTLLMESGPRTRVVIGDTTGRQLQVNFQLYNYAAIAARYPAGIAKVVGTGLVPISGY